MAPADVATAKAKATLIINLIIVSPDKRPDTLQAQGEADEGAKPNQPEWRTLWLATVILPFRQ